MTSSSATTLYDRLRGAQVVDVGSGPGSRIDSASAITLEESGTRWIVRVDRDFMPTTTPGDRIRCNLNGGQLPFSDGSFDAAVCMHVLEHVEAPRELVREIHRILRPGSPFLVAIPNGWSLSDNLYKLWKLVFRISKGEPQPHIQRFRRRSLERLLRESGFSVHHTSLIGESYTWLSRHPRTRKLLTTTTRALAKIHAPTFSYGWHIACERT